MKLESETYDSVWDALEDTVADAETMKARSDLMIGLQEHIRGWNLPLAEAAKRLGLTRPRLDDLMKGKIDRFSLEAMVAILPAAGLTMRMELRAA